jgi:hypothetical protein
MHSSAFITLALAVAASARPARFGRRADFTLQNGQDAIALKFVVSLDVQNIH